MFLGTKPSDKRACSCCKGLDGELVFDAKSAHVIDVDVSRNGKVKKGAVRVWLCQVCDYLYRNDLGYRANVATAVAIREFGGG